MAHVEVYCSPVMAQRDARNVGVGAAEAVGDNVVELEAGEAVAPFGSRGASAVKWSTQQKARTQPLFLVQAMVRPFPTEDQGPQIVPSWGRALRFLSREASRPLAHDAQDPLAADVDLLVAP